MDSAGDADGWLGSVVGSVWAVLLLEAAGWRTVGEGPREAQTALASLCVLDAPGRPLGGAPGSDLQQLREASVQQSNSRPVGE